MTRTAPLSVAPIEPTAVAAATKPVRTVAIQAKAPAPAPQPPVPESLSPDLRLVIEDDTAAKTYVYKIVNRMTGEVVNQYPREQLLKLRTAEDYQPGQVVSTDA